MNIHRLNLTFLVLCSLAPLKMKEVKPLLGMHATIPVFYSTGCEDWTAKEDSPQEGFTGLTTPHFA